MIGGIIFLLLLTIGFFVLSGFLFYYFYSNKRKMNLIIRKDFKSGGSFVGFWQRHKYKIVIFSAYLFLIIGFGFFFILVGL